MEARHQALSLCAGGAENRPIDGTDPSIVIGRARIAHELRRSEKTVSRWVRQGLLPAIKEGPFANSLLVVRAADIERLRPAPNGVRV
ncbi:hypothetical protein [uncultured Reyranella sp.]|uniref:hypothetical protein n=1 Tax=uncultured Reyranella sp. TaxID=735512 RepID=UPI0025F7268F|nr:hypothetical protein [uncultured Reyranella sp.]